MKNVGLILFVGMIALTTGCTLSLHSIFTSADVTYDQALEGAWTFKEGVWTIRPQDVQEGRYLIRTELKAQAPASFIGTLGTVGGATFLELSPARTDDIHLKTFYGSHFVGLRSFWKVSVKGDALTLTPMSYAWLEKGLKAHTLDIAFEKPEEGFLFLTAPTSELQAFIAANVENDEAFPSTGDAQGLLFVRQPVPATP